MAEPCGTPAGDMAHRRRGEAPCRNCLDARNAYQRARRAENPEWVDRDRTRAAARGRALSKLASRHPEEMQELLDAEMRELAGQAPAQPDQQDGGER